MKINTLKNEDGSVLVVAIIMLVLLTLIGIYANRTSSVDIQVAGNEKIYKRNLFTAEAATNEAMQLMQDWPDLKDAPPNWLSQTPGDITEDDAADETKWDDDNFTGATTQQVDAAIDPTNNTRFIVAFEGLGRRVSLDVTAPRPHVYSIYGRSTQNNGESIIKVGFKKPL